MMLGTGCYEDHNKMTDKIPVALPCPFCGTWHPKIAHHAGIIIISCKNETIKTKTCGCMMTISYDCPTDKELDYTLAKQREALRILVERWNTRPNKKEILQDGVAVNMRDS